MPPQKSSHFLVAAARARVARHVNPASEEILDVLNSESASESDLEVTTWTGGVNDHTFLSRDAWTDDSDDEGSLLSEAESVEIITSLEKQAGVEVVVMEKTASAVDSLMWHKTPAEWKKVESNRHLGYTRGALSGRSDRRRKQEERKKEEADAEKRNS